MEEEILVGLFYNYFVNNMELDREHFILYNQFYCGVSGSIVIA